MQARADAPPPPPPQPLPLLIISEGLKRAHSEAEEVATLCAGAAGFAALVAAPRRLACALLLRNTTRGAWPEALFLAAAAACAPLLAAGGGAGGAGNADGTGGAGDAGPADARLPPALEERIRDILLQHAALGGLIRSWRLEGVWATKPLLNGNDVVALLGVPRGPGLGMYVEELTRWQMLNPDASPADAQAFLRGVKNAGGPQAPGSLCCAEPGKGEGGER